MLGWLSELHGVFLGSAKTLMRRKCSGKIVLGWKHSKREQADEQSS